MATAPVSSGFGPSHFIPPGLGLLILGGHGLQFGNPAFATAQAWSTDAVRRLETKR